MQLCDVVKLKIEGGHNWSEFSNHYYCNSPDCRKIFHIWARGTYSKYPIIAKRKKEGLKFCPDCLNELIEITDGMIEASKSIKKQGELKFTEEERKEIFNDWKVEIKSIPTPMQQEVNNRRKNPLSPNKLRLSNAKYLLKNMNKKSFNWDKYDNGEIGGFK